MTLQIIALASKIFASEFVPRRENDEEEEPKNPKCNSERLKDLMSKVIMPQIRNRQNITIFSISQEPCPYQRGLSKNMPKSSLEATFRYFVLLTISVTSPEVICSAS